MKNRVKCKYILTKTAYYGYFRKIAQSVRLIFCLLELVEKRFQSDFFELVAIGLFAENQESAITLTFRAKRAILRFFDRYIFLNAFFDKKSNFVLLS